MSASGPPRGANGVLPEARRAVLEGAPMSDEGALNDFWPVHEPGGDRIGPRIGKVTAGAWSPRLERNIGYAWVPASHMAVGSSLTLQAHDGVRDATVAALPFVDPTKEIPKS